jgi:hypothetical protein
LGVSGQKVPATLGFWVSPDGKSQPRPILDEIDSRSGQVQGRPLLEVFNVDFRGIRYASLCFHMDEKLYGFTVEREPSPGTKLTVGGNGSGEGGTSYFYASVALGKGPATVERLEFTPDLKIARRDITDPNTCEPIYVDLYKDDKPVTRRYYKTVHSASGTSTEIDHSEDLK